MSKQSIFSALESWLEDEPIDRAVQSLFLSTDGEWNCELSFLQDGKAENHASISFRDKTMERAIHGALCRAHGGISSLRYAGVE